MAMNDAQFMNGGSKILNFIIEHLRTNLSNGRVVPSVDIKPGFFWKQVPNDAPEKGETFDQIFEDFKSLLLPGLYFDQNPHYFSLYPCGFSLASILGELAAQGTGSNVIGYYSGTPSGTELELVVMDWLGKMLKLPKQFLWGLEDRKPTGGGGVLQNSGSDSVLVTMLAARERCIHQYRRNFPDVDYHTVLSKLVAYASDQVHFCFDRAAMITAVRMRKLDSDGDYSLNSETLTAAVEADKKAGLLPFYLCATLGTTNNMAFDKMDALGPLCQREQIWMHVDAAYAGAAFICPEFRYLMEGVEYAESFNMNPHKWLLTGWNCSALWVKEKTSVTNVLRCTGSYLDYSKGEDFAEDFVHWEISVGRTMRAVRLWFVIRSYGLEGLQSYIRKHVRLARLFEGFVSKDDRFELETTAMGVVTFRLKGTDELNEALLDSINSEGIIVFSSVTVRDRFVLRFAVTSEHTNDEHVIHAWDAILVHGKKVSPRAF